MASIFSNLVTLMASRGRELLSSFWNKICNPIRLKTLLGKEEVELNSGSSEEKKTNEIVNKDLYLPSDLVAVILSSLALKDNIRSSVVCKTWYEIAASIRVRDPPCWLMFLKNGHNYNISYGFFDPVKRKKTNLMSLPELSTSSRILCSKDGWLLTYKSPFRDNLSLFNPFTRELIKLPRNRTKAKQEFAFSCAPTRRGCLVFAIEYFDGGVTISTWHPGATTWVNENFPDDIPTKSRDTINILYSDGLFYISLGIFIQVFDPSARTWNYFLVYLATIPGVDGWEKIRWMTEYKGQIYLVDASSAEPMVFRLNRLESVWEKKETLDGSSIFVSDGSCVMASGLTESMSNILYLWNHYINCRRPTKYFGGFEWERPYKYSLYSKSLCEEREGYYFECRDNGSMECFWIEPPHNIIGRDI